VAIVAIVPVLKELIAAITEVVRRLEAAVAGGILESGTLELLEISIVLSFPRSLHRLPRTSTLLLRRQRHDDDQTKAFIAEPFVKESLLTADEGAASGPGNNGLATGNQMGVSTTTPTATSPMIRSEPTPASSGIYPSGGSFSGDGLPHTETTGACNGDESDSSLLRQPGSSPRPSESDSPAAHGDVGAPGHAAEGEIAMHDGHNSDAETEPDHETKTREGARGERETTPPMASTTTPSTTSPTTASPTTTSAPATGAPPVETNTPAVPTTSTPHVTNPVPDRPASDRGTPIAFVHKSMDFVWCMHEMAGARATTTPTTSTTATTTATTSVSSSGIGSCGCLAYALHVLGTDITATILNTVTEQLINDRANSNLSRKSMRHQYSPDSSWTSQAVPEALKCVGQKGFIWRTLKGGELNHLKTLTSKGRFIVDGYMAKTCGYKSGKKKQTIDLHDDPPSKSRQAVAVAIWNGIVYCRNFGAVIGVDKTSVASIMHFGPHMRSRGYLNNIARVYRLQ
jgi:hypothetical protein